ncbi:MULTISPECIES: cytochrome c peroxidase [unclassified Spirosoma]|uniref:cytochrome-c peroxidase n=1 Tax=unclassified Spirosoma TaxID=2621999 RepID=UPI0025D3B647|nr:MULTISPECIES: cytochrome c peroxidase [unclassified Spirosoma]
MSLLLFGLAISCQPINRSNELRPDSTITEGEGVTFKPTPVSLRQPSNFPQRIYPIEQNPLTTQAILLGKSLFYDSQLSRDSTISCGFCHQPFAGFVHSDHALSHGINSRFGTRNVPSIQNMAWSRAFFWDGGEKSLDSLVINPLTNSAEMDMAFPEVLARVQRSPKYPGMFKAAFGSDTVTADRFFKAFSQFVLTLVSADSRYDKYVRQEPGGSLTADEVAGLSLFRQNCSTCHTTDLFTDHSYRNNGLAVSSINDQGRYLITGQQKDRLTFKVPSLRNVERTFPYMHDGRFSTLEQVMNHYASGVTNSPTLDESLIRNGQLGIPMTEVEKKQIISFLKTLTDTAFLTNRTLSPN